MKVTRLYIYPIKSLFGIQLNESSVTDRGLKYDRRWVLVDENNYHVTQREKPELVFLKTSITDNGLKVEDNRNGKQCFVPFSLSNTNAKRELINVFDDEFPAIEVSQEVNVWFSNALQKQVRLMFQPDDSHRTVDSKYALKRNDIVSNADGYPVLIISEESLAELNSKISEPVEMLRFRPNIVISGVNKSHGEDELGHLRIGNTEIVGVKNCARCVIPTNKLDGSKRNKEPMKTLASYRTVDMKVLFGRNFLIAKEGELEVGMEVIAL